MSSQFPFCELKKAVGYENVLQRIQQCFLYGEAQDVLFWNSTKAATFLKTFQIHFFLYGQENYVFKWKFMYV